MLPFWATVDLGAMAMKGFSEFPKLLYHWNLTIRLFSVICRTLIGGGGGSYSSAEVQSVYSTAPVNWAMSSLFYLYSLWDDRYSCCFMGCCLDDLFKIARNILAYIPPPCFYSNRGIDMVLFYRRAQISIWSITFMPFLYVRFNTFTWWNIAIEVYKLFY